MPHSSLPRRPIHHCNYLAGKSSQFPGVHRVLMRPPPMHPAFGRTSRVHRNPGSSKKQKQNFETSGLQEKILFWAEKSFLGINYSQRVYGEKIQKPRKSALVAHTHRGRRVKRARIRPLRVRGAGWRVQRRRRTENIGEAGIILESVCERSVNKLFDYRILTTQSTIKNAMYGNPRLTKCSVMNYA